MRIRCSRTNICCDSSSPSPYLPCYSETHCRLPLTRMCSACVPTPDSMRSLYTEAWDKAKQARVNQRAIRNVRKQRQAHERSFAQVCVGGEV